MPLLSWYKNNNKLPPHGQLVRTKKDLLSDEECKGMFLDDAFIVNRRPSSKGVYVGVAGKDLWFVEHPKGKVAVYLVEELY